MFRAVASETLRLYGRHFATLVALGIPPVALGAVAWFALDRVESPLLYHLASIAVGSVVYGFVYAAVAEWYRRRKTGDRDLPIYARVARLFPSICGISIVATFGIVLGLSRWSFQA